MICTNSGEMDFKKNALKVRRHFLQFVAFRSKTRQLAPLGQQWQGLTLLTYFLPSRVEQAFL